ncbi:VWA domain-containing protein [Spongiivirga sp. MCCC 1A20706]|uniref:vWA domain-containing protein n=1 Tax=Spongiivirga sp. MCCC 1A20706 TaxID=3160963 RepID=UPI003977609C
MKNYVAAMLSIALFLSSCGSFDDDGSIDPIASSCLDLGEANLKISIQDKFTTLPGKVSVFFKVNTIDDKAVSGLRASNFTIYERGRNDQCFNQISSSESFGRISPNTQIFKNNTFLVLDLSNSVLQSNLDALKTASISFINSVMPEEATDSFQMGIYWFNGEDELHLLNDLTSSKTELENAINGIDATISNDPSTDLYGAIIKATTLANTAIAEQEKLDIFAASSVVVFTDGTDQAARYSKNEALNSVNSANANASFFTIGLGDEIDVEILGELGKTASVIADNSQELEARFNEISIEVANQANSFYLFEYCSPKRDGSGRSELIIQVRSGEDRGAISTNFDATGFTAGCDQ